MRARVFAFAVLGLGAGCNQATFDVATIAPTNLANGLVAHWRFDDAAGGTAHDSSGNGRDGSVFGPGYSWSTGHFDGALQLSGYDAVTVGANFAGFPSATANYTVATWLYVASADADMAPPVAAILSNEVPWGVGPPGGWSLSLDAPGPGAGPAGRYRFTFWFGQQPDTFVEATCDCVIFDQWVHLAAVIDATNATLTFFVAGQARQQVPIPRGIFPAPGPLYMGRWPQPGHLLAGMLDDVAIYARALVPEEIILLSYAPAPNPM